MTITTLLLLCFHRQSLIKQPSRTGNMNVIKTFKFSRGGLCQIFGVCAIIQLVDDFILL